MVRQLVIVGPQTGSVDDDLQRPIAGVFQIDDRIGGEFLETTVVLAIGFGSDKSNLRFLRIQADFLGRCGES